MVKPTNEGYLGNTLIKRAGIETQYTEEELKEYIESRHPTDIGTCTIEIITDKGTGNIHMFSVSR